MMFFTEQCIVEQWNQCCASVAILGAHPVKGTANHVMQQRLDATGQNIAIFRLMPKPVLPVELTPTLSSSVVESCASRVKIADLLRPRFITPHIRTHVRSSGFADRAISYCIRDGCHLEQLGPISSSGGKYSLKEIA